MRNFDQWKAEVEVILRDFRRVDAPGNKDEFDALEYEIEFYKDRIEYEFTIDAAAGTVLEYESEYDD